MVTLVAAVNHFSLYPGRGGLALLGAVVSVVLGLLLRRQRRHANTARQIAAINSYVARLNQMANEVHDKRELLSQACELAVSEGGFRFSAVLGTVDGKDSDEDLVTIYETAQSNQSFLDPIKSFARRALGVGEPSFLKGDLTLLKVANPWQRLFRTRRTTVILPLNRYMATPCVLILVTFDKGYQFPVNHVVRELIVELANDLMEAARRIDLIKRDLEISALNESLLGSLGVGINVVRYPERVIEIANQRLLDIAGANDLEEFKNTPARSFYRDDEEYDRVGQFAKLVQQNGSGSLDTVAYRKLTGEPIYIDMSGRMLDLDDGLVRIVWTQIDVTARVEADRQRNKLSRLRDVLLNNTVAGIDLVEYPARRIIEANQAFAEMLGYSDVSEVIGIEMTSLYTLNSENERMIALVRAVLTSGHGGLSDLQVLKKDGSSIFLDVHGRLLPDGDSESQIIVWTSVDVTGRHKLNDELRRHAHFDSLTNLPNRRALHQYLNEALSRVRSEGCYLAVGVIDLDDFKPINDAYGHPVGDELLKEFSDRLRLALRAGDFASRLGGDEFVVILEGLSLETLESQLESVLARLHKTVETQFLLEGQFLVNVGMSMGIAFSNGGIDEPDILVRMADSAMYSIKKLKGSRKKWWMIADSKLEDAGEIVTIDPFGSEVSNLLDSLKAYISPLIGPFVSHFYEHLIHQGTISKNFALIPSSQLDVVKGIQVRSLLSIVDSAIDIDQLKEQSRHLGATHAYIGTLSSALVEITNLYRKFIEEALDALAIRSIDRLLAQSAIEERLKLDLQMQLEAMDEAIEEYLAVLSNPIPEMDGNWLDAMVQEATSLVALPGILGCQLWRQNLEGIFHPEINEGELRVAIEQIITSASAPRLDSRARTGTGMVPLAMLTGEITLSNSYTIDPRTAPWHELLSPLGVRSIVAIPMTNQGSPSGVLVLHGAYPNQFSSKWSTSFSIELRQRLAQLLRSYGENPVRVSTGNGEEYRKLLYSGSLTMYGQPIVELTSGDTVKVEMLARMIRSDGSIATPASFMSSFNEADLDTLFLQGLDHSLRQLQAWDRQGLVVSVSLNIAPSTVLNPQSNVWIRQSLETYGIDPQRLTLELIENQEITSEFHSEAVRSLSKIGVLLAIDDLGSGYSSLKRLASLPFDIIKIDQSIVRALEYDPISNLSLIRTIIQIGADFDRYVIVEGVETEAEIEAVRLLGASYVQGFGVTKPMPLEELYQWTADRTWQPPNGRQVTSFLGALAYHMSYFHFDSISNDPDASQCPVTSFLVGNGHGDGEASDWHRMIHSNRMNRDTTRELARSFMDWLAGRVRIEEA